MRHAGSSRINPRDRTWIPLVLICFVLPQAILSSGCGEKNIRSVWRDRDIVIDGIADEWQGARTYVDDPNLALGAMNDDEYLYISMATPVRSVAAQIVALGFTVWLDPRGGDDTDFGIRCPVGFQDFKMMREASRDPDRLDDLLAESAARLEVLGPGKDERIMLVNDGGTGIEIGIGHRDGTFGYELKVPLTTETGHTYTLGTGIKTVGVGFETAEADMDEIRKSMEGRTPPGGGSGGRDGAEGGGDRDGRMVPPGDMGGGGVHMFGGPEQLQIWTKVTLASPQAKAE